MGGLRFLGVRYLYLLPNNQLMAKSANNLSLPDFSQSPKIDKVGVEERVSRFQKRSIKAESKLQGLKMALNILDTKQIKTLVMPL